MASTLISFARIRKEATVPRDDSKASHPLTISSVSTDAPGWNSQQYESNLLMTFSRFLRRNPMLSLKSSMSAIHFARPLLSSIAYLRSR